MLHLSLLTRRAASCGTSRRNKGLLLFKVAPTDYAEAGGTSCDGRIRNGALCPPVNLVSGVRGDIIGGAPERVPVWEIASPSTLLRSCPLLVVGSFISKGGCYAWKYPPRSASAFLVPVAAYHPPSCRWDRRPLQRSLGGSTARRCSAGTGRPLIPVTRARTFVWHLYR
jgi:hypothetical protein